MLVFIAVVILFLMCLNWMTGLPEPIDKVDAIKNIKSNKKSNVDYKIDNMTNKIIVKIEEGSYVKESLERICNVVEFESAFVRGTGLIKDPILSYQQLNDKNEYHHIEKKFEGIYQMTIAHGDITFKNNIPYLQLNVILLSVDNKNGKINVMSGKLNGGTVISSAEFLVEPINFKIERNPNINPTSYNHEWILTDYDTI